MLAPLTSPDLSAWARELCEAAQRLVPGVHASVYLAGDATRGVVHTTLDESLTRPYFEHWWATDVPMLEILRRRMAVGHSLMVCSEREYYDAPLYHEYIRPSGIDISVGLSAFRADGPSPRLMLTHTRRPDDLARTTALLVTLAPAFAAGADAWYRARGAALEQAGAALVCDAQGRVLHETAALTALLAERPVVAERVRAAARALAAATGAALQPRPHDAPGGALAALDAAPRLLETAGGAFRLRCTRAPDALVPGRMALLVTVEAPAAGGAPALPTPEHRASPVAIPSPAADAALGRAMARFGLTAQEQAVARLLIERRTNEEIGMALGISENTARTHAERVRRKLGVARRTEVAAVLGAG
jgi:DNA-binding CsgD family transcriptional regulator